VVGDDDRRRVFRTARAALAKSGTVTLELALAGLPMVAAYRVAAWEAFIIRRFARVSTVILANLVLGDDTAVPEFLQEQCRADALAPALAAILRDGPERQRQLDAFVRLADLMSTGERTPSERAADVVIETLAVRLAGA
jgi:lipid-A-disaccharide synthase